jgi:hypothetical protein
MKYVIQTLSPGFIFDELEEVRKQFVDALTYTMESANVFFDKEASDPLDIYIEYDFQQKNNHEVVYGFNLREEIAKNFALDVEKNHSSKQLLGISKSLRDLADDIESRYDPEHTKTLAETKDKKETEYAKKVNRSYSEILRDAIAEDEALQKNHSQKKLNDQKDS